MKIYSPIEMMIYILENPLEFFIFSFIFGVLLTVAANSKSALGIKLFKNLFTIATLYFVVSVFLTYVDYQNSADHQFSLVFFSHFKVIEIVALVASLWLGQSTARRVNPDSILKTAEIFSGNFPIKEKELSAVALNYFGLLFLIPFSIGITFIYNVLFISIILVPASLLGLYDDEWNRVLPTAALGTLFFIVGLTSASIIRVSKIRNDGNN